MVRIFNRLLVIVVAIAATACGSGSDGVPPCPPNCGPGIATIVVEAGPRIIVFSGDTVTLSGSATHPDNLVLQYQWSQISGPQVIISSSSSPTATFVAPHVATREDFESMVFLLTVTASDGASGGDLIDINVTGPVGVFAVDHQQGTVGSTFFTGDPLHATLMSHIEIESNDSIEMAAALSFPQRLASERIGASVVGTIGNSLSSDPFICDRLDIYIFSASVAGTFDFKLCRMNLMCSTAADMPGWHMSLRDQDSNELAYTSVDGLGDHSFAAYLDAGVPYYVSVTAADAVAGGEYQLSIISD